jgi:hypothetical protein
MQLAVRELFDELPLSLLHAECSTVGAPSRR